MIDWSNPSNEALAALDLARRQLRFHTRRTINLYSGRRGLNEIHVAEIIVYAKDSFWYTQARLWANKPPGNLTVPPTFTLGAQTLLALVDAGYDGTTWWKPPAAWNEKETKALFIALADFFLMVEQIRQNTLLCPSATFQVVADIILGINWEKRFKKVAAALNARMTTEPQPTVNEQDDTLLALSGEGADGD